MFPRITAARHTGDYELELTFSDGVVARVDFETMVAGRGGVFRALEDPAFFAQAHVDVDAGIVVWPNEVDFCPCSPKLRSCTRFLLASSATPAWRAQSFQMIAF
jgi:hypothetical protein